MMAMLRATAGSSTTACAARLRADIADGLAAAARETLETTFVMTLVKAIAIPLLMLLLIPFVMALLEALMPCTSRPPPERRLARDAPSAASRHA